MLAMIAAAAALALAETPPAVAPAAAAQPAVPAPVQAALDKAKAGDTADLLKMADGGDADAQHVVGRLYIFGGANIPRDPAKGCAYEEKASARLGVAALSTAECYQTGVGGQLDPPKAKAAYQKAIDLGYAPAKCALGKMLMAETDSTEAARGLSLCTEAANAGDANAQTAVGDAYFNGKGARTDKKAARGWYEKAAAQKQPLANRMLGQMYLTGDGGKKDKKKAMALWRTAEAAGDPIAPTLMADQLFSELTGGKTPGPGTYAFKGGIPTTDVDTVIAWYQEALKRDPRPETKARAEQALNALNTFKAAAVKVETK